MARAAQWISSGKMNPIPGSSHSPPETKFLNLSPRPNCCSVVKACLHKKNEQSLMTKRSQRSPKRLVTISTSEGRWHGKWDCDYVFSLQDLQLGDLLEDAEPDTLVSVSLSVQKHTGFGLSVDGKISTSFTRKCINCYSAFSREIDAKFNVWVLPSSRNRGIPNELPEIGSDDPSVIFVKPGCEADLSSLIQENVRLATAVKETCSESCEKSEPKLQHLGAKNAASIHRRWSRLLELKNVY